MMTSASNRWLGAALLLFTACFPPLGWRIEGSGVSLTEGRSVPAFSKVSLSSGVVATVDTGMRAVTVTGDDNLLQYLETFVQNDTLVVRVRPSVALLPRTTLRAAITNDLVQGLTTSGGAVGVAMATPADTFRIQASGGSRATVSGVSCQSLPIDASGGSTVTVNGAATHVRPTVSGGSTVLTRDTSAIDAVVNVSGGSTCTVRATGSVTGEVSGASHLIVFGGGSIDVDRSGASTVERGEQ